MSDVRSGAVLMADIAAATEFRARVGDRAADAELDPLIQAFTVIVAKNGGRVLKSDGDDILAIFEGGAPAVVAAANAAIECQLRARQARHSLYAGLHPGAIEFREVLGRPDVAGMPVNMAARLHKLVPDLPGQIFLAAEAVRDLPDALRARIRPYGSRQLKGVGTIDVFTLDWDESVTVVPTRFAASATTPATTSGALTLRYLNHTARLPEGSAPVQIGRERASTLVVEDGEQMVSSRHIKIFSRNGAWIAQDISRNGTWFRFGRSASENRLLGEEIKLLGSGLMCLGRPFSEDPDGRFTVRFEVAHR
ncbi:MAG TPA: FHA domain-containing protein [Nevskiaceae bacterium]|nr:FHA domain-containing protein [Nevskiaceae bacterium]